MPLFDRFLQGIHGPFVDWAMGLNGKVSEVSFYPGAKGKKTRTVVLEAWCGNLLFSIGGCCLSTNNRAKLSREFAKKLSVRLSGHSPSFFRPTKSLSFTNCWSHHRRCEFWCLRCTKHHVKAPFPLATGHTWSGRAQPFQTGVNKYLQRLNRS
jgi:hypothetical protein